jgi:hypothetical protein
VRLIYSVLSPAGVERSGASGASGGVGAAWDELHCGEVEVDPCDAVREAMATVLHDRHGIAADRIGRITIDSVAGWMTATVYLFPGPPAAKPSARRAAPLARRKVDRDAEDGNDTNDGGPLAC